MNGDKPRLLLFSHLCSAGFVSGAEKLLLLFARELKLRYQCVLVVPGEGVISAQARALGMEVVVFEIPLCTALYSGSHSAAAHLEELKGQFVYQRLLALLVREKPSYVFVNTSVHPLPAIAAKSLGIPIVWTMMETIHPTPHRYLAVDAINEASDVIAGISRATLQPFQGHPGAGKTLLLSPYVALHEMDPSSWPYHRFQIRQQFGWQDSHCVIGYVSGSIYPQKGLEPFIRAALLLKDSAPGARFLVVGNPIDEDYFRMCLNMVQESGLSARFGWIRFEENIQRVYSAMDIVVVSSLQSEGFGMTALEGMSFGKPVVAFSSGGLAEILEATGNGGYLVRTGDVPGLASKLEWLLNDASLRLDVGNRNAAAAQAAFGVETLRAQLDQLRARLPASGFPSPLVKGNGNTVYLIENRRRRPFVSETAFLQRGFRFEDVTRVDDKELRRWHRGSSIREWPDRGSGESPSSRKKRRRKRSRPSARRKRSQAPVRRRPAERSVRKRRSKPSARRIPRKRYGRRR
ncbi:glycosyltransferase [Cohnella sp. CFH 77786]|uniref:glycosyltransferase family 4 protein n=1 Tax=Cohnella sp. CFH 77786 TaxID=2662265 RepID=UPI001C60D46D|nr:glycosyltransferase family 4 protein [Cohnella sp. CFH 77786]MBW5447391.1 glycosyltransferase [Cohnella sp. CFH 77786]